MTSAQDIHDEIGEAVVVNHGTKTYRPVGEWDAAEYPDEVLGYSLATQR